MASDTLLSIDDSLEVLQLRKAALKSYDYNVEIAASGEAAIKMLRELPVAAVLLKYKLEGMNTEAVAYDIKQRFPGLPIILVSAYSEIPERTLWLVDDYVMKGELPDGIVRVLQRALHSAKTRATCTVAASINVTGMDCFPVYAESPHGASTLKYMEMAEEEVDRAIAEVIGKRGHYD